MKFKNARVTKAANELAEALYIEGYDFTTLTVTKLKQPAVDYVIVTPFGKVQVVEEKP